MNKGEFIIDKNHEKERLDNVCLSFMPNLTRSHIKLLIEKGNILLDGEKIKSGEKVKCGQKISYNYEEVKPLDVIPQDIDFEIIYQDEDLLVVNKPQGLVVHPCSSTKSGTLVNGLLNRIKDLSGINGVLRPGIVHRLDKNTSGLMLVAKNDFAHNHLAEQIKNKTCQRKYLALCEGVFGKNEGRIETFLERNKKDRKKMAVSDKGKKAITDYKVIKCFKNKTLVEFTLQTGRTHQIRVHCQMINHPIIGDDVYGVAEKGLSGQLLHAYYIKFIQPSSQKEMRFTIDLPNYFKDYLNKLS